MALNLTKDLISRFNVTGPRYTSYPTAPEWQDDFPVSQYETALAQFNSGSKTLSLYVHIPFCPTMCYYCGCNVVIRKPKQAVGDDYIAYLAKELELITYSLNRRPLVKQLHLGGGTPNSLSPTQLARLMQVIQTAVELDFSGEIAIEVDPRTVTHDHIVMLKKLGFNRISMGIQDFDTTVQKAINREQPFEQVAQLMDWIRDAGFTSVNMDLIYGLPHQTPETVANTIRQVLELSPERIALYSYAHVPWLKSHQNLIAETSLPDAETKLDLFLTAQTLFTQNGYQAIGMDHFAKASDEMAIAYQENRLYRNFMGYTVKPADEYIGIGVTSIGFLENTFIQNTRDLTTYYATLDQGQLPISRGLALSPDDQQRQWVIAQLMCHFRLIKAEFNTRFAADFDTLFATEQAHLATCEQDGLLTQTPEGIHITDLGKLFIRNVCMGFDAYFQAAQTKRRFSKTV
ncbi:MAG: oxygen-independent coproporphyrinogen III oxidase [Candidatus Margulisiibacteriota bacterium]